MAPHGIYPSRGEDCWVAIACRDDRDWRALKGVLVDPRLAEGRFDALSGRLADEDALDAIVGAWTRERDKFAAASALQGAGVPAAAVQTPRERIDEDPATADWGLWPVVDHPEMGRVRVDGLPVHLGATDWRIARGAPLLGQHNDYVYGELLGLPSAEIDELRDEGVL
jgi:crotonobetainyl-CoA:carnitine CoA-transferase CaiB-like acyl-CoA transferase